MYGTRSVDSVSDTRHLSGRQPDRSGHRGGGVGEHLLVVLNQASGLAEQLEAEQPVELRPGDDRVERGVDREVEPEADDQRSDVAARTRRHRRRAGVEQTVRVGVDHHAHERERHSRARRDRRYLAPGRVVAKVFNPMVAGMTRIGISMWGSRVLAVPGRTSGAIRTVPVNVLTFEGERYLVAPRGVTQWVRNVRAAGRCELQVGRRVESVVATELPDEAKPAILRAYLRRWRWEVGQFFDGVGTDATDAELRTISAGYPVFRLGPAA